MGKNMAEAAKSSKRPQASVRPTRRTIGRLIRYEITELFGIFNYSFDLDAEGLTLLTGVNGTGKSTILRTIDAISTGNWFALLEIPFKSLTLGFDSDRELVVSRMKSQVTVALTGEDTWSLSTSSPSSSPSERGFAREPEVFLSRYNQLLSLEREASAISEAAVRAELA